MILVILNRLFARMSSVIHVIWVSPISGSSYHQGSLARRSRKFLLRPVSSLYQSILPCYIFFRLFSYTSSSQILIDFCSRCFNILDIFTKEVYLFQYLIFRYWLCLSWSLSSIVKPSDSTFTSSQHGSIPLISSRNNIKSRQ